MGFLDSVKGMLGSKKGANPVASNDPNSLIQQAQQFATNNKELVSGAIDKVTKEVPGTLDDQIGEAAKNAISADSKPKFK